MDHVSKMFHRELIAYAGELGAYPNESFEDCAHRFERKGDADRAKLFQWIAYRWWQLEGVGPGA